MALTHVYFMQEALKEARKALEIGELPIGAVVVCAGKIIARSHNAVQQLQDATAHAEILSICAANNYMGNKYLSDCWLYVTLQPCLMCQGALFWSKIGGLVYAAKDPKATTPLHLHPRTTLITSVLEEEAADLLKQFFAQKRLTR